MCVCSCLVCKLALASAFGVSIYCSISASDLRIERYTLGEAGTEVVHGVQGREVVHGVHGWSAWMECKVQRLCMECMDGVHGWSARYRGCAWSAWMECKVQRLCMECMDGVQDGVQGTEVVHGVQ